MLVTDIEGKKTSWILRGEEVGQDSRARSDLHITARQLLKLRFPTHQLLEEVPFKPHSWVTLYLDFYLPLRKLAVEVHGQQHYKYSSLFHTSRSVFLKQLRNDDDKIEWCNLNGITLVILPYDTVPTWKDLL